MSVAADHVGYEKAAIRHERSLDAFEQTFQIHDVMQGVAGDDGVILSRRAPGIEIGGGQEQMRLDSGAVRGGASAFEHRWIQFDALENEIVIACGAKLPRELNFEIAVARAQTDKSPCAAGFLATLQVQIFAKHLRCVVEAEPGEFGTDVAVRPVVEDTGHIVNVLAVFKEALFRVERCLIILRHILM